MLRNFIIDCILVDTTVCSIAFARATNVIT